MKLLVFVLFFLAISSQALQARNIKVHDDDILMKTTCSETMFEITSSFIASWEVLEIRDYAVIQVMQTNDFILAHNIVEELRKIIMEPILVDHGFENNEIVYTIKVGRFSNVDEAVEYHNMLR